MDRDDHDRHLDARLYDAIHRGQGGDLRFYRGLCKGVRSVLELGCGAGRILLELARLGCEVTGLDRDDGHLALCRERALEEGLSPRLVLGDVVAFDIPGARFDRILAPYNVLTCVLDDTDLADVLDAVRSHLAFEGWFVFDGYALDPDDLPDEEAEPRPPDPLVTFVDGDETVRVFERDVRRPGPGRIDVEYTFHLHRPGRGVRVRTQIVRHRVRTPEAWAAAVRSAGFRIVDGPRDHRPAGSAPWFSIVAKSAGGTAG